MKHMMLGHWSALKFLELLLRAADEKHSLPLYTSEGHKLVHADTHIHFEAYVKTLQMWIDWLHQAE